MKLRFAVLLAVALAAPTSIAWSSAGSWEPDTQDDIDDGLFFWETDTDPNPNVKKVYFNAFPSDGTAGLVLGGAPNPNVGALHTRVLPLPNMAFTAYLGVWKDCNQDGYIGLGETGHLYYLSALLTDPSVCPPDTFFNYNGYVSEFWSIGSRQQRDPVEDFPRVIYDGAARVWGDFGNINAEDQANEVHFDCTHFPWQEGTADSTGGALLTFDCFLSYNVAKQMNENDPTPNKDLTWDYEGDNGEGYYHPDYDCESDLNVQTDTYGNSPCEDESNVGLLESNTTRPSATIWDCSDYEETFTDVGPEIGETSVDPIIEDEIYVNNSRGYLLSISNPPSVSPDASNGLDGSVYDVVNYAGATDCSTDGFGHNNGPGEFILSASFAGTNPSDGKRVADFNMTAGTFGSGVSGRNPKSIEDSNEDIDAINEEAGTSIPHLEVPDGVPRTVPTNAGLTSGTRGGNYNSNVIYLPPTYMGPSVRDEDLTKPAGGVYFTFYADLTPSTAYSLPSAAGGTYGTEACNGDFGEGSGANGANIQNGWECNPNLWWMDFDIGRGTEDNTNFGKDGCVDEDEVDGCDDDPTPGDHYFIRDIDCYDGSLFGIVPAANGVGAGLSLLDEQDGPCGTPVFPE